MPSYSSLVILDHACLFHHPPFPAPHPLWLAPIFPPSPQPCYIFPPRHFHPPTLVLPSLLQVTKCPKYVLPLTDASPPACPTPSSPSGKPPGATPKVPWRLLPGEDKTLKRLPGLEGGTKPWWGRWEPCTSKRCSLPSDVPSKRRPSKSSPKPSCSAKQKISMLRSFWALLVKEVNFCGSWRFGYRI